MKICVLGLGNMGLPVAVNLAKAGHDVTGANIVAVPAASAAGVTVSTDATVTLADRELTFCLLPDLPYLEPMLPALIAGGTRDLVVMSTISPTRVRELAERLAGQVNVLDACMSGGVAKAQDGTMSIMCGGDAAVFERLRPIMDVIGGTVELMGEVGAGAVTKACNQMVVAGTLVALAEATLVAKQNGLDAHHVLKVLGAGLAASELLEQKADKLAGEDFSPSGPAKFLVKDLDFAADSADGLSLPSLAVSRELFTGLTDAGLGDLDNSVVLQYLRDRG
ncbi:NAD(P)-dependent oxidoreductase [Micropruina sp.]|uniref:NAD(P)-dependent oxidoreductase n=1 Tax=Micropruina sp. TaxID=2737536 RepID=UPI0039E63CDD